MIYMWVAPNQEQHGFISVSEMTGLVKPLLGTYLKPR